MNAGEADSDALVSQTYRKRIEELVKAACARYGLGRRKDALLTRQEEEFGERVGREGTKRFLYRTNRPGRSN
jgi:hypothetical protein